MTQERLLAKRADYEEEVRKDDANFWRTSNDLPPEANLRSSAGRTDPPKYLEFAGASEAGELPGDSSFQPLKRENVYNLWLNSAPETDFFKGHGRGKNVAAGHDARASGHAAGRKIGYR